MHHIMSRIDTLSTMPRFSYVLSEELVAETTNQISMLAVRTNNSKSKKTFGELTETTIGLSWKS